MLNKGSKWLVLILGIFLVVGWRDINTSWSKEKNAVKSKKASVTNHSNLYEKPEITKEKVYRIELNATTLEDLEFFKRLGLECVQDEDFKCKANNRQLRELERSGYEFSIIEEGIQVKNTPSDFGLNLPLTKSVSGDNDTNYAIP